jgi:release factor glutamine methyltransferase
VRDNDVFSAAAGRYDLIIFDPPFRWFRPRDRRERASTHENYATLRASFAKANDRLTADGRMLMFFGSSGDIDYFQGLSDEASVHREVLRTGDLERDGQTVTYFVFRLTA